jgi:hypothetical protein
MEDIGLIGAGELVEVVQQDMGRTRGVSDRFAIELPTRAQGLHKD